MNETSTTNRLFPSRRRKSVPYGQEQSMRKTVRDIEERMERKLQEVDAVIDASFVRFRQQLQILQLLAHQNAVDSRIQNALANIRGAE